MPEEHAPTPEPGDAQDALPDSSAPIFPPDQSPDAPMAAPSDAPQAAPAAMEQAPGEGGEGESRGRGPTAVVRYGLMLNVGEFRHSLERPPRPGTKVVIRTDRGVELGEVTESVCAESCDRCISPERLDRFVRDNGPEYPFRRDGKILRVANPQDVIDFRHLETSAREAGAYCREKIRELKLDMKVVAVEHLLGGERLVFYFTSESRVDFRDLVRQLASQYRTRIEMRQVGARDEARLVGDYERCGQRCCCQQYLKDLRPISMRMAKTQKATLDPSKISGRCGRLMCCLRYEDETYEDLRKRLPRRNVWVRTATGVVGRVIDGQILTQLVRLALNDGSMVNVPNEEIVERNVEPLAPAPVAQRPAPREERGPRQFLRDQVESPEAAPVEVEPAAPVGAPEPQPDAAPPAAGGEGERGKRRRRRRKKKPGAFAPGGQPQGAPNRPAPQPGQGTQGFGEGGKRRKRRRRKKKGGAQGGLPGGPAGPGGPSTPPPQA
ncbi:MAG TPA: hypothetical protein DCX07_12870 [Phycisphaerales bacterium]|nr:hypothetical protein [Phycisphaerales bacterium]